MLIVLTTILLRCSDDEDGTQSSAYLFKTEEHAIAAVNSAYDVLGWLESQEVYEWFIGDICSDDAEKGGENIADWAELQDLKMFRANAENSILESRWSEPYVGVYWASLVIENVPGIDMDSDLRDRIVGEAKFLRAYFYFQLVKTFGGVPLFTEPIDPGEYCQSRASIDECWTQIENDLIDASALLIEKSEYSAGDLGRATKGAANSLLAKAYIYHGKFSEAEQAAYTVIISGEYDLEPNYEDIFTLTHENGIESIFEVQHFEIKTDKWGNYNEGQITSFYQGCINDKWFPGFGFNCPTQDFVDEFEPNDPRLDATVIFNGEEIRVGTPCAEYLDTGPATEGGYNPTGYCVQKYLLECQEKAPAISNAPANWRVIRYADLLLFHAEAANENGNTSVALESLNKVRARVGLPDVATTDQSALRDAIYHERRVELGLEGHRFFDIVRQGRAAMLLAKNGFIEGRHEYFPIPQIELYACNKLEQNPY